MTIISYLLDRRTLARGLGGILVATPVGLYVSSPYDNGWLRLVAFLLPIVTMSAVLHRAPNEVVATVIRLDERFPRADRDGLEFARDITEDQPRIHHRVLG